MLRMLPQAATENDVSPAPPAGHAPLTVMDTPLYQGEPRPFAEMATPLYQGEPRPFTEMTTPPFLGEPHPIYLR